MPLTGEKKRTYTREYMREWRKRVSDRDRLAKKINASLDYCSHCGWHGVCDVHHLDEDRANNRADNMAVLCPNCHRDIHTGGLRGCKDADKQG